jgi:hypothetical protein
MASAANFKSHEHNQKNHEDRTRRKRSHESWLANLVRRLRRKRIPDRSMGVTYRADPSSNSNRGIIATCTFLELLGETHRGQFILRMSGWSKNLRAGLCGRCGKNPPEAGKTRCAPCAESVNAARKKWAAENPKANQANKNDFWKSERGKIAIRKRRKKFNEYRKVWRKNKRKGK